VSDAEVKPALVEQFIINADNLHKIREQVHYEK
jgi:hypothetical protein